MTPEGWRVKPVEETLEVVKDGISLAELSLLDEVALYSLPGYDAGRTVERGPGKAIGSNKYRVPRECVLLSKLNPRIPRVWRVSHFEESSPVCSTEFWPLVAGESQASNLNLDFLSCLLRSPIFLEHPLIKPASTTNSHQRIEELAFRRFELLLPPLPEQRKIAAILSSVDAAIEGTQAVIDQLHVVKQAMMADLLTRGLPGRHKKFKQTDIGEVPEEWAVVSLGSLASFVTSGSRGWAEYYATEGALFIRSQNVRAGVLDFSDRAFVRVPAGAEGERTRVASSDVLITITGNSVGNVAEAPEGLGDAYVSQHVGLVRLKEPSEASFVATYLSPGAPGNAQVLAAQYGQSKPGLSLTNVRSFLIPTPSFAEMSEIQAAVASVQDRIGGEERELESLRDTKSALMSVLLSGEVRVRVDEESAA
jgi:restriction endonuclease S subunit